MRAFAIALISLATMTAAARAQDPAGLAPVTPAKKAADDPNDKGAKKADAKSDKAQPARRPMPGFVTYGQAAWAGPEANVRATKVLAKYFDEAFPNGLPIGVDEKGLKSVTLSSVKAVRKFLPNGGHPDVLKDGSIESLEDAGSLAGQLVAAKLNVRFNTIGAFGDHEEGAKNPLHMRDLKLVRGVDGNLQKSTIERLLKIADRALAGGYGKPEDWRKDFIDTNDDGEKDVSLEDLRRALAIVNANFEDGENDGRLAAKGYTNEVPADPNAAAAAATAGAAAGAANADDDEDAGDDKLKESRKELEAANAARDSELARLEAEHDENTTRARNEARKSGDVAAYETKKAELDAQFQRKRAEILAKHQAQLAKFRAKHGRAHPGRGKGLQLEDGERRGNDRDDKKDKNDKRDKKKDDKDARDGG